MLQVMLVRTATSNAIATRQVGSVQACIYAMQQNTTLAGPYTDECMKKSVESFNSALFIGLVKARNEAKGCDSP